MLEGKTKAGFKYKVPDSSLDNMELVDALAEIDKNPLAISKVVVMLLGEEQKQAMYDFYRTKKGNVPVDKISDAIGEIFNAHNDAKNS